MSEQKTKLEELADKIINLAVSTEEWRTDSNKREAIMYLVRGHTSEALNVMMNISETTLNDGDFELRMKRLCEDYGFMFISFPQPKFM